MVYMTLVKCFDKCNENKIGIPDYIELSKKLVAMHGIGKLKPSMATHFKNFLLTSIEYSFNEPPSSFTFVEALHAFISRGLINQNMLKDIYSQLKDFLLQTDPDMKKCNEWPSIISFSNSLAR